MSGPRTTVDELLEAARAQLRRVTPREANVAMGDGAVMIDIRSDAQRARDGVLPQATVVDRNALEWRLDPASPHRDRALARRGVTVMLICNEGYQSSLAAATLRRFGLDATDVIGGFQAWRAEGLEVIAEGSRGRRAPSDRER